MIYFFKKLDMTQRVQGFETQRMSSFPKCLSEIRGFRQIIYSFQIVNSLEDREGKHLDNNYLYLVCHFPY